MIGLINDTGILVVVVALVMLFGASQIPKLARSLGEANKEFKRATHEGEDASAPPALTSATHGTGAAPSEPITISRADLEALLDNVATRSSGRQ